MTIKRIQVRETQKYYGIFDGKLEDIIASLQSELDSGWEGIESEYEWDYGGEKYIEYYLYKFREENDKEYANRLKLLEKEKANKAKEKERRRKQYEKLKEEFGDD